MKLRSLRPLFIAIALGGSALGIYSCSKQTSADLENEPANLISSTPETQVWQFKVLNKTYVLPEGKLPWQAQLDKIIVEYNTLLKENDLELIGYKHIESINTLQELREAKNNVSNLFPQYTSPSNFTIVESNSLKYRFKPYLDSMLPDTKDRAYIASLTGLKKEKAYLFEENDLGVVNLVWKYKGETKNTRCFVSNKRGLIYDNLLYSIHYKPADQSKNMARKKKNLPRLLTLSEGGEGGGSLNCSENYFPSYTFNLSDAEYDFMGDRIYYYSISVVVSGRCDNGKKSISFKDLNSSYDAGFGYSCIADVETKSFVTGTSGHLDFAFAWAWSNSVTVGLEWDGVSFTITGTGATGAKGERYVTPGMLQ